MGTSCVYLPVVTWLTGLLSKGKGAFFSKSGLLKIFNVWKYCVDGFANGAFTRPAMDCDMCTIK